jgi:2-amino-4-hydroxy-6-hydroxymethyldihydropteridine diphosphokinase
MNQPRTAHIAIGSNLGQRELIIASAMRSLGDHSGIEVRRVSRVMETEPVGPPRQGRYLNAAAELCTTLEPRELLEVSLTIERQHGRERTPGGRWGPRTLDLDLLLFADLVVDEPGLRVPHPRMHERMFVLEPLAEIAGDLMHPTLGRSIRSLRDELASHQAMMESSSGGGVHR